MADLAKAQPGVTFRIRQEESKSIALSKTGPQLVAGYLLSNISATVLARAAPMVVEYQLGNKSTATITLTVTINKKEERFTRLLKQTGGAVEQEVFQLPESFGTFFLEELVCDQLVTRIQSSRRQQVVTDRLAGGCNL